MTPDRGQLVQMDCFCIGRLSRVTGTVWQYTAIDVASSYCWAELYVNASEFRSHEFEEAIARLKARHIFIRAGRPQTNGAVERMQRTVLEECWKPAFARYLIPKYTALRLDLDRYFRYYNNDRAHTGRLTKGRTPEEVIGKVNMRSR